MTFYLNEPVLYKQTEQVIIVQAFNLFYYTIQLNNGKQLLASKEDLTKIFKYKPGDIILLTRLNETDLFKEPLKVSIINYIIHKSSPFYEIKDPSNTNYFVQESWLQEIKDNNDPSGRCNCDLINLIKTGCTCGSINRYIPTNIFF